VASATTRALLAVLFFAVPIVCSTRFMGAFASPKWHLLVLCAFLLLMAQLSRPHALPVPRFLVDVRFALFALAGLAVASCLRDGLPASAAPLVARAAGVALVVALASELRVHPSSLGLIAGAVCVSASLITAAGLAQLVGLDPLAALPGGDERSAFFGNVNLAAQFLGFAVILMLLQLGRSGRGMRAALEALLAATLAYLHLLACRSVLIALGVAALPWIIARRLAPATIVRTGAGAAALVLLITGPLETPETRARVTLAHANKALSSEIRLGLWSGTAAMVRDNPFGVGAGNFADRFVAYQADGALTPSEDLLYTAPHNEYLRVTAEEGWLFAVLIAALGGAFLLALDRAPAVSRWRSEPGVLIGSLLAYGAIEAFFQFPLATACGLLAIAFAVAFGLSVLPVDDRTTFAPAWLRRAIAAACGLALIVEGRLVASEWLVVRGPEDRAGLEDACRLDPRNSEACVRAAWTQVRDGDRPAAVATLDGVLRRQPRYFPAVKLLGESLLWWGDRETGCAALWLYDGLFQHASSARQKRRRLCPGDEAADYGGRMRVPWYGDFPLPPAPEP
jgi:O-antigen ligase/polysaccharide polymerase Wzy-like membrane protein